MFADSGKDAKKLASGAVENGVIRLYPAGGVVCLAEGIETALSVHALTGLPAWSVVSLSGMKRFGYIYQRLLIAAGNMVVAGMLAITISH